MCLRNGTVAQKQTNGGPHTRKQEEFRLAYINDPNVEFAVLLLQRLILSY